MEVFEVFRRAGHRDPFEHCGNVIAPDSDMALLLAKECFLRRQEGQHLWVVARSDIHSFSDESVLELAADKSYRFASAYRDVMHKRERAHDRVRELQVS
ncbi:MAG: ring,2-phenylacetyl-CoA epoxidase subunit PaaB [Actinomycetota bacterium]|jgi:ring-1,2-phenylacetyl-CoA epoxidase subunit PaaB|nr:ring,2-phenylacetyl-CoA epoxidase subunit PaaB [Actinomycetota bacterium]